MSLINTKTIAHIISTNCSGLPTAALKRYRTQRLAIHVPTVRDNAQRRSLASPCTAPNIASLRPNPESKWTMLGRLAQTEFAIPSYRSQEQFLGNAMSLALSSWGFRRRSGIAALGIWAAVRTGMHVFMSHTPLRIEWTSIPFVGDSTFNSRACLS